jgi:hypothetical protein
MDMKYATKRARRPIDTTKKVPDRSLAAWADNDVGSVSLAAVSAAEAFI